MDIIKFLNIVMETGLFPDIWKLRNMVLIPKLAGLLHFTQFRPLVLLDTLRKTLLGIISQRQTKMWTHFKMIDDNQYAFLPGKNTSHPLLNLLLMTEDAKQYQKELYVISQDIRKAYDTVEPYLGKEMALRRMGMPEQIIDLYNLL